MNISTDDPKPLLVTIPQGCRAIGIGPTKIYELINDGAIKTTTIGRRRLIVFASLEAFVAKSQEKGGNHAASR